MNYIYAESAVKPTSIEIQKNVVYLRKDMVEKKRTYEDRDAETFWSYKEAKMTPEEFNEYMNRLNVENAINSAADSKNISNLLIGQEIGDNNQLIIMEAIADLYDVIASMM